ncbi:CRISPR-associated protein Cas5 [Microaerobacter geothermalis]|uniref:CRISPR-associated protein Cas5 n=1 Tax=Microaerobacter geothermalis TaxID=674972 RepID=UPI001F4436F2|nr:CRISPR-associated protein Cas5 [Microaerobacter geothermalis]
MQGKMAHFRRYYSNSSALSYSIPPRTTIIGILAGLLGYKRDSYYDLFALDQCKIAMANCSPIKKQMQKMNLLKIERPNEFNGSNEYHSQTPTELILPQNIRTGIIDYHIWVYHKDPKVMEILEQLFRSTSYGFSSYGISLALGTACHLGWLKFESEWEGEYKNIPESVHVESVIPAKYVERLEVEVDKQHEYRLVKEDLPLEFDQGRRLTEHGKGNMIINLIPYPIKAIVTSHVKLNNGQAITWME